MKRLSDLEPAEVSLVPKGANKRKFLVLKSGEKSVMTKEELLKILCAGPDTMKAVNKVIKDFNDGYANVVASHEQVDAEKKPVASGFNELDIDEMFNAPIDDKGLAATEKAEPPAPVMPKQTEKANVPQNLDQEMGPLDDRAQSALKAVVRILTPFKENLSPVLIHEVLDAAGFQMAAQPTSDGGDAMHKEASARQSPEPIKEEHRIEAMKVAKAAAKKAYDEHVQKLGYQKYPEEQIAQKDLAIHVAGHEDDDEGEEEEQEGTMHNPDAASEGKSAMHKTGVMKSLMEKVPAEVRPVVEAIYKGQLEAVKKANDLEKELATVTRAAKRKEMVAKALGYGKLGVDAESLADTLLVLSEKAPKEFEKVEKILQGANEQITKGDLFAEFGTNQARNGNGSWDAIEKSAEGYIAKSGEKVSKAEAVDRFLKTPEGVKMYDEYTNELRKAQRGA